MTLHTHPQKGGMRWIFQGRHTIRLRPLPKKYFRILDPASEYGGLSGEGGPPPSPSFSECPEKSLSAGIQKRDDGRIAASEAYNGSPLNRVEVPSNLHPLRVELS